MSVPVIHDQRTSINSCGLKKQVSKDCKSVKNQGDGAWGASNTWSPPVSSDLTCETSQLTAHLLHTHLSNRSIAHPGHKDCMIRGQELFGKLARLSHPTCLQRQILAWQHIHGRYCIDMHILTARLQASCATGSRSRATCGSHHGT